jgi:hypothetical protein
MLAALTALAIAAAVFVVIRRRRQRALKLIFPLRDGDGGASNGLLLELAAE